MAAEAMEATSGESWNDRVIREVRAGQAQVHGGYEREALLLLTTRGARSGRERVTPLATFEYQGDLLVAATAGGSDRHPDWYLNLSANSRVTVEHWSGGELRRFEAEARRVESGEERDRLWQFIVAREGGFAQAQSGTERVIPVVRFVAAPA